MKASSKRIAILGTRGIPNVYGGFEELAEHLAVYLADRGHHVVVYQTHNHPFKDQTYKGVVIERCYNAEVILGTFGQFAYDFNCQWHARKQHFDVWLHLGYTSNTLWSFLWPKTVKHVSNMDGLEWKRQKYVPIVQRFLRWAEKQAAIHSDVLVADHLEMAKYLKQTFSVDSALIGYGASEITAEKPNIDLPESFDLMMARMEPENHIDLILASQLHVRRPLVVAGHLTNRYARALIKRYPPGKKIYWLGGVYHKPHAEWLRKNCTYYIHGHSVGGTNPSLIQAMASGCRIIAHDNVFNRGVLSKDAVGYFKDAEYLGELRRKQAASTPDWAVPSWSSICKAYESILVK